jgi:hypothetical protein
MSRRKRKRYRYATEKINCPLCNKSLRLSTLAKGHLSNVHPGLSQSDIDIIREKAKNIAWSFKTKNNKV